MKKIIVFILIVLAILAVLLISLFGFLGSNSYIENEIEKANYCDAKEDCVDAGGKCPFGCYVYVNKDEVNKIKSLIASFKSNCIYKCIYCPEVECKNNKCESVCQ